MKIFIDGGKFTSREEAHAYLNVQLGLPDYYGNNLDALWDALTEYDNTVTIEIINIPQLIESLGDYGKSLLQVFKEAEEVNSNLKVNVNG